MSCHAQNERVGLHFTPGLQRDIALRKDGLQVDKNGADAGQLLQETHAHRDENWPVVDGFSQLGPGDAALQTDAVLH